MELNHTNLKIISINVNSIVSLQRRNELLIFINRNNPDIVLLNETKLKPFHNIEFKNYNFIRTDRLTNKGGGTAILTRRSLDYEIISNPSSINNTLLKFTIIKIKLKNGSNLYIISSYATNDNRDIFIAKLNSLCEKLKFFLPENYYLLIGDLNARHNNWGDKNFNQRGLYLDNWLNTTGIKYKATLMPPSTPTFNSASFLDICINDHRIECIIIIIINYDSDHRAILIEIKLDEPLPLILLTNPKLYKATDCTKYQKTITKNIKELIPHTRNLSIPEIDTHITTLNDIILDALNSTVPTRKPTDNMSRYLNKKIIQLHKQKSSLLTKLHKLLRNNAITNPSEIIQLKENIKNLNIKLKYQYLKSTNQSWENLLKKSTYIILKIFYR